MIGLHKRVLTYYTKCDISETAVNKTIGRALVTIILMTTER